MLCYDLLCYIIYVTLYFSSYLFIFFKKNWYDANTLNN